MKRARPTHAPIDEHPLDEARRLRRERDSLRERVTALRERVAALKDEIRALTARVGRLWALVTKLRPLRAHRSEDTILL